jgi:hypothetical protein
MLFHLILPGNQRADKKYLCYDRDEKFLYALTHVHPRTHQKRVVNGAYFFHSCDAPFLLTSDKSSDTLRLVECRGEQA